MPHSFPLNSYVVSKDGKHYRKILAKLGYLRYVSWCWNKGGYADKDSYGLMQCDQANKFMTLAEMNAYYNPCSVKEATGKDEKAEMKNRDIYYYIDSTGYICNDTWSNNPTDIFRFKSNNAFKTRDEAEARLKEIMG